ncbi:MAG: hypothetical protein GX860_11105 [Alcaligenaceae bacterium]|nr:hypothetical protein [Alcaligenaceae bacterium]
MTHRQWYEITDLSTDIMDPYSADCHYERILEDQGVIREDFMLDVYYKHGSDSIRGSLSYRHGQCDGIVVYVTTRGRDVVQEEPLVEELIDNNYAVAAFDPVEDFSRQVVNIFRVVSFAGLRRDLGTDAIYVWAEGSLAKAALAEALGDPRIRGLMLEEYDRGDEWSKALQAYGSRPLLKTSSASEAILWLKEVKE